MTSGSQDERKLTLQEAARYLGVSRRKMGGLVKDGEVEFTIDPLDRRRHLVGVSQLDELKRRSVGRVKGERARAGEQGKETTG